MTRRLVMTSFGWNDSGGGTIVPRVAAAELARRGWDVTVFHAAVAPLPGAGPYALREWEEDGVRLVGVHNRAHGLLDLRNPAREIDDPPITDAFAATLNRVRPDAIHFHNLHNLGAALLDVAAARGIRSYFSTHNYWLICPRLYLMQGDGSLCAGPAGGRDCARCVGGVDPDAYAERLREVRGRFTRAIDVCLAVSEPVKATLVAQGYPQEMIDVVRQAMPADDDVWERLGRAREPGRRGDRLVVGFFGSAYWHKGPQLLIEAAQKVRGDVVVKIHGEVPARFAAELRALDRRGVVELCGQFMHADLPSLLAGVDVAAMPSMWWDCAPLMARECLAGRVPLLAPRMGGLGASVRNDVDGLLFDGLSAEDLAEKIDRLAAEDGLLERLQQGIEAPRPFADYVDDLEAYYNGQRPARALERTAARAAVRWVGDHGLNTSLSIINRHAVSALETVERVERDGRRVGAPLPRAADVEVRHQWPPDFSPAPSGRLAVIQPWEFGAVPREWVDLIDANVDEVWVPSECVKGMYVGSGVDGDRVHVIPNGYDPRLFKPDGPRLEQLDAAGVKLLFVGGFIPRKGPDLLLDAYARAFADRDDVTLVVKDFGAAGVYRGGDRSALRAWVEERRLPRIVHLERELSSDEMAALYRACDVLVHPYRGEGFAMPVLEALACGVPVITTAGGPTDEFCPDDASWRIPARRVEMAEHRVGDFDTVGAPWMLEPDVVALAELMRSAADDADARAAKAAAAARAARALAWPAVAERYRARIDELARRAPRICAGDLSFEEDADLRVIAAPAWRGDSGLGELLRAWSDATTPSTSACLYLAADPAVDGPTEEIFERIVEAARTAGADLDSAADVTLFVPPQRARGDEALHAASDAYVSLPGAAPGHLRRAEATGNPVLEPSQLRAWLDTAAARIAA